MSKISPCLWFDSNAEEAVDFYVSVFKNARKKDVWRYGASGPGREGSVSFVLFEIEGQTFQALNGGPHFSFTPAISLSIACEDQAEIDRLWDALSDGGGEKGQCGWLTDKFGVSWQIAPAMMEAAMHGADLVKTDRWMKAIMGMTKLDIATLQKAADGK